MIEQKSNRGLLSATVPLHLALLLFSDCLLGAELWPPQISSWPEGGNESLQDTPLQFSLGVSDHVVGDLGSLSSTVWQLPEASMGWRGTQWGGELPLHPGPQRV